MSLLVDP